MAANMTKEFAATMAHDISACQEEVSRASHEVADLHVRSVVVEARATAAEAHVSELEEELVLCRQSVSNEH